jgi:cytoskeleton protein RodZ
MDLGTVLRSARERRHLSLNQLAQTTKIGVRVLAAIENNEFQQLPGGLYTRGMLRAYAREVGLDPENTITQYRAQFEPEPATSGKLAASETVQTQRGDSGVSRTDADSEHAERRAIRLGLLVGSVALALGLVAYLTFTPWREPASSAGRRSVPSLIPVGETVPTAEPAASSVSDRAVSTAGNALRLDIRAQGLCWVSATADGRRVVYRLMRQRDHETIAFEDEVILRVGDPAALALAINGMPGRPLGRAGEAVTIHITRENHRDFMIQ